MSASTILLPIQPSAMSTAHLAAVSYLARYAGRTHTLYAYQLKRWFGWCESNGLDPLVGIQRAHVELQTRHLGEAGLMDSSVTTMMHGVRGFFRFTWVANSDAPPIFGGGYLQRVLAPLESHLGLLPGAIRQRATA